MHTIYIYIYMYTKDVLLHLIKAWERTLKKRGGEIGKHKLNELGTLKMNLKVKQSRWKLMIII